MSPVLPASGATVCHSSSVMNGMNGCASRSVASSTRASVRRVPRCAASSPCASCDLRELQVPVAELVPDELVDRLRREVEAVLRRGASRPRASACCSRETIQRSGEGQRDRQRRVEPDVPALDVHQPEARRVPQLVAEVAVAFAAREVEVERPAVGRERGEREAQRVGAERGDAVRELLPRALLDRRLLALGPSARRCAGPTSVSRSTPSIRSIGSSVLPFDFDIFWPSSSRTSALM